MHKKMTKMISLMMALGMAFSITACGGGGTSGSGGNGNSSGGGSTSDKDKTVLNVGVWNGGGGYRWAELVAQEFEEKYANVSFEPGKMGVKVDINPQKNAFFVSSIQSAIAQNVNAEDIYYTTFNANVDYARGGYSMNITDWVTEKVYTADGELADMTYDPVTKKYVLNAGAEEPTLSLADKMLNGYKDAFNLGVDELDFNGDGTSDIEEGYYAIPYENYIAGFIYDHDLFEEQGWLDYDGIDGLPDTMEDFFNLLNRISDTGMIPFTFAKGQAEYVSKTLTNAFIAQYEGQAAAELNYTYDGEYTFPADTFDAATVAQEGITVNNDGTQTVTITPANAWMLAYQPSKELYVEFMRKLFDTKYFDPDLYQATYSYTTAQQEFVWSSMGKPGQPRIAMLYEGEWWENEARSYFSYTGGYGKRDFRYFPLPEIEGQKDASVRSLADYSKGTDIIVNKKTTKPELCRLWLQFAHTETALETFTLEVGATRAYDYDLDSTQLSTLSKFAQNCYKIKMSDTSGVTIFSPKIYSEQHPFYDNTAMGGYGSDVLSTSVGAFGKVAWSEQHLAAVFVKLAGQAGAEYLSAADYIDGMYEYYTKENWTTAYNTWLTMQG